MTTSLHSTRRYQVGQRLLRRRRSLVKVSRMIAVSIVAFVVSWSPYCVVCLVAMIQKTYLMSRGEAEIPELMAKASVIYNPLVYLLMDRHTTRTLKRLVFCKSGLHWTNNLIGLRELGSLYARVLWYGSRQM